MRRYLRARRLDAVTSGLKHNARPKVLAFLGQKGGSGKTTLAVHVAVAAQSDGEQVLLVCTDPQASAIAWGDASKNERHLGSPIVLTAAPTQIGEILKTAIADIISLVIIDTAPHADAMAAQAVAEADLVLLPCRPTAFDLKAVGAAMKIAKASKRPSAIILSACPAQAPENLEARKVLEKFDILVVSTIIADRRASARAIASGRSATEFGRAAEEITIFWDWISQRLGMRNETTNG
jgi:chromosome partitioning protein